MACDRTVPRHGGCLRSRYQAYVQRTGRRVEVPKMVLPAGTYWFTLADSDSDRNIVEIWDANRMHLITTILAIPDYRLKPKGHTVIHFDERPAGSPEAINSWFYPGAGYGEEFVYPKTRAVQLANDRTDFLYQVESGSSSDAATRTRPVSHHRA
jgi:hypothetical protein